MKFRLKRLRAPVKLVIASVAVSAICLGAPQPTLAMPYAGATQGQALSDLQVGELQDIVDKYPDLFGGLWGDPTSHSVTIRLSVKAPSPSRQRAGTEDLEAVGGPTDRYANTQPKQWHAHLMQYGPSLASLNVLLRKVTSEQSWVRDSYRSRINWYVDPRLGKVAIGVDQITPRLLISAEMTFGGLAELRLADRPVLHSRLLDSQPYWGGDSVVTSNGQECTVGFEAYKSVNGTFHYGMLTAGHCWSTGTRISQGYFDNNGVIHTTGTMGNVSARSWGNNVVDAEFIDSTATGTQIQDYVYITPVPYYRRVTTEGTSFIGLVECFDGAVTGENCHGYVQFRNLCEQFEIYYECHLDDNYSNNGSTLATEGDSGGPVEKNDGHGGMIAYGTDVGGTSTDEYDSEIQYALSGLNAGLIVN